MYKAYFKEIFETNKSVIIPGLGSFTKNNAIITFNPYLKFNDGFLAGFIAKKQSIAIDTAGNLIAENVDKINIALNNSGEALVLGLGVLKKSADGKIVFVQHDTVDESDAQVNQPMIEKVITEEKIIIPQTEVKTSLEKPELEKPKEIIQKNEISNEVKDVKAPELKEVVIENNKSNNKKVEKQKDNKETQKKGENEKKPKRKLPVVLMLIVVVIGGASIFAVLKWDMVKGWIGMDNNKTAKIEPKEKTIEKPVADTLVNNVVVADSITQDSIGVVSESMPVVDDNKIENAKPEKITQEKTQNSFGNFHIIVGCYSSQQNAENMVQKLVGEGHQANNMGLRNGLYMVSAGDFSSADEANSKLQTLKSNYPKAWLYNGL